MFTKLFRAQSRPVLAAAAALAVFFLDAVLAPSMAAAQSDPAALAPWQAPPNQRAWSSDESVYPTGGYSETPRLASTTTDDSPQYGAALPDNGQGSVEPGENALFNQGIADGCAECGVPGDGCDEGCGMPDGMACPCDVCMPYAPLWFRGEYLAWWGKSGSLPPLVATESGTTVLFGGDNVAPNAHSGGRFSLGWWCSPCRDEGLEVTYMFLGNEAVKFDQASPGTPVLERPFYDTENAAQSSVFVAYPGTQSGSVSARVVNELNSIEAIYRQALVRQCGHEADFLLGYRYGQFNEDFTIDTSTSFLTISGAGLRVTDQFQTKNEFHGAEVGFSTKTQYDRWSLELLAKLGLGSTQSRVDISGSSVATVRNVPQPATQQGMLALASNSGSSSQNNFSVIPELGVTLGYDLTCRMKATLGYTFLYWSQVARPGDQIDTDLNLSQIPPRQLTGVPSPEFRFITTDFWAQGISVGLDYRF